jgi:hypothetical protein
VNPFDVAQPPPCTDDWLLIILGSFCRKFAISGIGDLRTYIDYLVKFVFLSEPARQIGDQMGVIEVHGGSTRIARSSGKR